MDHPCHTPELARLYDSCARDFPRLFDLPEGQGLGMAAEFDGAEDAADVQHDLRVLRGIPCAEVKHTFERGLHSVWVVLRKPAAAVAQ
jgi:hypothetical protein